MYRLLIAAALMVATYCSPALADRSTTVNIPSGTQIKMYVAGDVDAEGVHPGDSFQAQAASDVVVDGLVVVRKGAEARGTVGEARRTGGNSAANGLVLTFDWVAAADGTKIKLSAQNQAARNAASPAATAPASLNAFGMAGFFGIVGAFARDNVSVQTSTQAGR